MNYDLMSYDLGNWFNHGLRAGVATRMNTDEI